MKSFHTLLSLGALLALAIPFSALSGADPAAKPALSSATDCSNCSPRLELDLSGDWYCVLDRVSGDYDENVQYALATGPKIVHLPGTLDEAGIGDPNPEKSDQHLSPLLVYEGAAWFQRDIDVPSNWAGRHVVLTLERTKVTKVWVNGQYVGGNDLVYVPQRFDLTTFIKPGETNRIVISVDNNPKLVPVDGSHAYSPDTQGNWNGIIGRMALDSSAGGIRMENIRIIPSAANRSLRVDVDLTGEATPDSPAMIALSVSRVDGATTLFVSPRAVTEGETVSTTFDLGPDAAFWTDETPNLYNVEVTLSDNGVPVETRSFTTALRDFRATPDGFTINGNKVTLRGKHDACVFPLTGHPPMDVEAWVRYFEIYKQYGLNYMRCHTWTPPEAAYEAADRVGIYIQGELPIWWGMDFKNAAKVDYMHRLGTAILDEYGNHPSFVMFALGNEIPKDREDLKAMVDFLRAHDPRPLYAQGSNNRLWDPSYAEGDDYWTSFRTGLWQEDGSTDARLSMAYLDSHGVGGLLNQNRPSTAFNFDKALERSPVPFSGFEVGQYQVFPNFSELPKYTGVMKPLNLELYRDRLEKAGMLDQAQDFFRASGALSVICYRADIEAMLRTRRFAAFNLLDLQDYPGQGTALVGMLDAFMDSKGLITPEDWRKFCSETVILAELPQYCWADSETFSAKILLRNDGKADLSNGHVAWKLSDGEKVLASGSVAVNAPAHSGLVRSSEAVAVSLAGLVKAPAELELSLAIEGADISTSYPVWVYPPAGKVEVPDNVIVAESLTPEVAKALENGSHVVLLPKLAAVEAHSVPMQFISEFWNWQMFTGFAEQFKKEKPPGTLGLLIDDKSPAFALFPTSFHTDYQWWPVCQNSRALILDDFPGYRPLAQAIDNIARDHRLGLISEFKVGKGSVLVTACPLASLAEKYPEARQLYESLLAYAAGDSFAPATETTVEKLRGLGL